MPHRVDDDRLTFAALALRDALVAALKCLGWPGFARRADVAGRGPHCANESSRDGAAGAADLPADTAPASRRAGSRTRADLGMGVDQTERTRRTRILEIQRRQHPLTPKAPKQTRQNEGCARPITIASLQSRGAVSKRQAAAARRLLAALREGCIPYQEAKAAVGRRSFDVVESVIVLQEPIGHYAAAPASRRPAPAPGCARHAGGVLRPGVHRPESRYHPKPRSRPRQSEITLIIQ